MLTFILEYNYYIFDRFIIRQNNYILKINNKFIYNATIYPLTKFNNIMNFFRSLNAIYQVATHFMFYLNGVFIKGIFTRDKDDNLNIYTVHY